MIFTPGKTPPESLPAPARAPEPLAEDRAGDHHGEHSSGSSIPVRFLDWQVARIKAEITDASRFVETASLDPFGMSLTLQTTSRPCPGRTTEASRSSSRAEVPSSEAGTSPEAITPALIKPR